MAAKRDRCVNFSLEESTKLVFFVKKYVEVLENKKTDAVTAQKKVRAFKYVVFVFVFGFSSKWPGLYALDLGYAICHLHFEKGLARPSLRPIQPRHL
jgi:Myb/SANT-like DNA-binding domain